MYIAPFEEITSPIGVFTFQWRQRQAPSFPTPSNKFANGLVQNTVMAHPERPLSPLSPSPPLARQLWLAEAIRQLERDGWLDDDAVLRKLRSATGSSDGGPHAAGQHETQTLVLARAEQLADRNPIAGEIASEIHAFQAAGKLLATILAVIAVIAGATTAAALLGSGTINVVLAWSTLLGPHLITLAAWCLGLAFSARHAGFTRGGGWAYLTQRLFGGKHRLLLVQALTTLVARTRMAFWVFSLASHALWGVFFTSAALTLTYLFALHEYRFTWETTILPSTFFVHFVDILGWLPRQFGLQLPTPEAVIRLTDDESTRQAWAAWLLSGVLTYGLLPRTVLAALSRYKHTDHKRRLALDLEQPYYVRLLQRMDTRLRPEVRIVDPAPPPGPDHAVMQTLPTGGGAHDTLADGLIFGFELHDDVAWPPAVLPQGIVAEANLASLAERQALLARLARAQPRRLVVACDARSGLDRGTLHYLDDVARHCGALGILLLNQAAARAGRAENWKEELIEHGVAPTLIFAELADALAWLRPAPSATAAGTPNLNLRHE